MKTMNDLIKFLANGSDENRDSYNRLKKYWMLTTSQLIEMPLKQRQSQYLTLYRNFLADYYSDIVVVKQDLELMAKKLLGSSLRFGNSPECIISMVEIYADGIWDTSGDFIKELFRTNMSEFQGVRCNHLNPVELLPSDPSKLKFMNKLLEGPRIYYYGGRMDIKVLGKYLPFSILLRQFRDHNHELMESDVTKIGNDKEKEKLNKFGKANYMFDKLFNIKDSDYTKIMEKTAREETLNSPPNHVGFSLRRINDPFYESEPRRNLRVQSGSYTGLSGPYKYHEWNFSIA